MTEEKQFRLSEPNIIMKLPAVLLLLTALKIVSGDYPFDCSEILKKDHSKPSGVYTIYPYGESPDGLQVYCDMETLGGGWTVFQRRIDGMESFHRLFGLYKNGFGNVSTEYWLGLENIYKLTNLGKKMKLLVDMEDFEGNKAFAMYEHFSVQSEFEGYRLNVNGYTDSDFSETQRAGDSLKAHDQQSFSAYDHRWPWEVPTLSWPNIHARHYLGGFWHTAHSTGDLNGFYTFGAGDWFSKLGVRWQSFKGPHYSLKSTSMKIRPLK